MKLFLTGWELDAAYKDADKDGSGVIEIDEFMGNMASFKTHGTMPMLFQPKMRSTGVADTMQWGADRRRQRRRRAQALAQHEGRVLRGRGRKRGEMNTFS